METSNEFLQKECLRLQVQLSAASMAQLSGILIRKQYKKNEIVLDQYAFCTDIYFIEKGLLRQFYYKDSRDVSEHFSGELDIVMCLESLFKKEQTQLMIEALEDTTVYCLNYERFIALCDENREINRFYRRIIENGLVCSQIKADAFRFESSRERYERFCNEYAHVVYRIPMHHIASYLLMSPETLSRVRAGIL